MNTQQRQSVSTGAYPQLIQTLLNTASPQTAKYHGHALRADYSCGVVVRTADGFKTITVPPRALELMADGIMVDKDRDFIRQQLGQA